jgi:hypothetical protein
MSWRGDSDEAGVSEEVGGVSAGSARKGGRNSVDDSGDDAVGRLAKDPHTIAQFYEEERTSK